ncbi:ribonuclease E/G-like protein, chloroplastic isoform X4 [Magnolia sinica]|uniref:ribonuclease E/G-like protein, chloroplastic isoform X4 n=1 Tax=Magnolia sinica TaxID=86752 RepID=UPI00265987FA|nr:ribonuclease E/G-like protein, chloroplastic isoform X4 [Magnolia sinica]
MVMGVCDVRPPPFPLGWNRAFRPSRFGVERALLPRCLFHRMPLQNAFKITLHLRIQSCLLNSPVMSASKGNSTTKRWELCKVLWSIEADIEDGQLLHITGDLPALGCWEPDMAILMSPSREHANLWKTEIKVPCGLNFKYNYFVKGDKWPSSDLVWRPGPEFSLSVPLHFKQNEKIVVRDSWMKTRIERLPVPSWGSWMEDTYLLPQPIEVSGNHVPSAGEKDIIRSLKKISLGQKPFSVDLMVEDKSHSVDKEMTKNASNPRWNKALTISERDQPVEEPWLLQSSIFSFEFKETSDSNISSKGSIQNEGKQLDFHEKDDQGLEGVVPEEDNKLARIEESISTVILINSSICTMQRIAVLEDGKLVELLLEPVKNTVHCNSAYLGVVTKLVPHMGGAFVDIGISRPSLMDIKQNREPFVYPPFRRKTKERKVEGSLISDHKEHDPDAHEHDLAAHREDEIIDEFLDADLQDDSVESVRFMNEDFEEHEVEDDMDVSDALKGNINGAVFDYGGGEADFEDYFEENGHHIEGETVNEFLPLEMESSNDSELSHHMLQDLKVSDNSQSDVNKWAHVRKGTKVIVQVVKEGLGTKGPALTAYPNLKSRFWVKSMVVDSPRTYHEVTNYLQEIAPDLCDRVELYDKRIPIFDEYGIEEEINNILSKRVPLSNGGSLVIEQTEALVSIDVNGGHGMLGQGTSQEKAVLDVNLAAAKQIARELRLRDIGGIIVVDFIDMVDDSNKRLVYEEIKKAVERDRSIVKVSELSRHGLMEITRKRVRPSVSFMISEPCGCCHATGRVEALETSFSKIEHEICRLLAISNQKADPENAKSWPRIMLRVDRHMCNYLTLGKRTKLAVLSSSLKVWILLKVARGLARGVFEVKPFTDDKANSDQQQVAISRLRPTEGRSYIPSSKLMVFPVKKWKGSRK